MRLIQPTALAWLSPMPAKSISEMPTDESLRPSCGGLGCLVSKGNKNVYISNSASSQFDNTSGQYHSTITFVTVPCCRDIYCEGAGSWTTITRGEGRLRKRTGRECLIVCLWDYATYLNDRSILVHRDRGGIHPTTVGPRWQGDK
jgi:hypothetical protein